MARINTRAFVFLQNIIKKVIGQKFVYKFVSFPEILKMDPVMVESGRSGEDSGGATSEAEAEDEEGGGRDRYLHSGSFLPSFSVGSLRSLEPQWPLKTEPGSDRHEDGSSVIRFISNRRRSSFASTPPPSSTDASAPSGPSDPCCSSPPQSPTGARRTESEEFERGAQPLNLSSGQRGRERARSSGTPERRGLASGAHSEGKKPKGLEISSSLLLTGSDLVSIALNSPALPSGSLTPAFFSAQVSPHTQYTSNSAAHKLGLG